MGYLLEKVISNLSVWSSEPDLANDTVELLVCLVEKRERCVSVCVCVCLCASVCLFPQGTSMR